MARNEEGDIDIAIGNKQLLSIVFILFVLFGVVFSMGYFVGRASSGDASPPAKPAESASPSGRPDAAGPRAAAPAQTGVPVETAAEEPPLQPGEGRVTEAKPAAATSDQTPAAAPAPTPAPPAVETPKPAPPPPAKPVEAAAPLPGQVFLQVAAVKREQAQVMADVLKEKGFRTVMVPIKRSDGQELWRTLVGPLKDAAEVAKTKAALDSAGIPYFVKKF